MKEPELIKRCREQHNKLSSKGNEGVADCEVCGDCIRAYNTLYEKYDKWLKENKKK